MQKLSIPTEKDFPRNVFTSKANVLKFLQNKIKKSKIEYIKNF